MTRDQVTEDGEYMDDRDGLTASVRRVVIRPLRDCRRRRAKAKKAKQVSRKGAKARSKKKNRG